MVWEHMKEVISIVTRYEANFRAEMEQKLRLQSEETVLVHRKLLAQAGKRIGELDRLFVKVYEDEQAQLKIEVKSLQQEIEVRELQIENRE